MEVCRFKIKHTVRKTEIETRISESIRLAEKAFGKAKVRLYAAYFLSGHWAVVDISSKVGEYVATKFAEILINDYGEESFSVERILNENYPRIKGFV